MRRALLLWLGLLPAVASDLAPEVLYLAKLQRFYRERFETLARQTCLVRIDRFERYRAEQLFKRIDTLAFDVAIIGAQEYFGLPGSSRIDMESPSDVVRQGLTSTGELGLHIRAILVTRAATIRHRGGSCYAFEMPELFSGYVVSNEHGSVTTAYSGTFCGDGKETRLRSLRIVTAELPAATGMWTAELDWTFGGGSGELDGILPESSRTRILHRSGYEVENRIHYSHCRPVEVETRISFENPGTLPAETTKGVAPRRWLPDGLTFDVDLDPQDPGNRAVHGRLRRTLAFRGGEIPAGSPVTARDTRGGLTLEHIDAPDGAWFVYAERRRGSQWRTIPFPIR